MDYEKKYKEAFERAKKFYEQGTITESLSYIFPELKESEDERIRKWLICGMNALKEQKNETFANIPIDDAIAWLEKQGKPSNESVFCAEDKEIYQAISVGLTDMVDDFGWSDFGGMPIEDIQEWLKKKVKQEPFDKNFAPKVEHLIPQKGMYYTCIKDYYSSDNTHLYVKGNIYKSSLSGYIEDEAHLGLSWTNSCAEKYFEQTKNDDWIVCEHDNVIGKPMQYKEFKNKEMQRFIENLKAQGLTPKLRLWNIQDAENGNILAFYAEYKGNKMVQVGIIEKYVGKYGGCSNTFKTYVGVNWENNLQIGDHMGCSDIRPATKEQRDTLMKAMANAGYTFDFEKKVLKKIEQKQEWTEEDEKMCQETIDWFEKKCFPYALESENPARESIKWLKSLKDKSTWKPSDEQMHVLKDLVEDNTQRHFYHILKSLYDDLKKLKEWKNENTY